MPTLNLPFAHLNLRRNPFCELPRSEWAHVVVPDIDTTALAERLRQGGTPGQGLVAQFLGHCGRGKSSHLLALQRQFPNAPYRYFAEDGPRPRAVEDVAGALFRSHTSARSSAAAPPPVLFLDETQRIPWRVRRALFRRVRERGASLVIGTHKDHSREIRSAGLTLTAHRVRGLAPAKLMAICERRIALVARRPPPAPVPCVGLHAAEALIDRHGDNLRAIVSDLYDLFQSLEHLTEIQSIGDPYVAL